MADDFDTVIDNKIKDAIRNNKDDGVSILQYYYQNGYDILASAKRKLYNPLTLAIINENEAVFNWLITLEGIDVNDRDRMRCVAGLSPLMSAVKFRNPDFVLKLLEKGADVNLTNKGNATALGLVNIEDGWRALYGPEKQAVKQILKILLDHGADVNQICDRAGDTLLHNIILSENTELFSELLNTAKDLDVNLQNYDGRTPLFYAVKKENMIMIEALLKADADPTITDNYGYKPLDISSDQSSRAISKLLMEYELKYSLNL